MLLDDHSEFFIQLRRPTAGDVGGHLSAKGDEAEWHHGFQARLQKKIDALPSTGVLATRLFASSHCACTGLAGPATCAAKSVSRLRTYLSKI